MNTLAMAAEGTSHEIDLLLLASRRGFSPQESELLQRSLSESLDWSFIMKEASRHRLLALLYSSLKSQRCLDSVPPDARRILEAVVRDETTRSLMLTGELIRILRAFDREHIPALPFKGPVLSLAAYGDFSLRSCCDLDILVDQENLGRARDLLMESGYAPAFSLNAQQEREYLKTECALQMVDQGRGYVIELHWRFSERHTSLSLPLADFWDRSIPVSLGDITAPTLCPEDLLLYLCFHGAKHCWERVEWICCLAEFIRVNHELDWAAIFARAEMYRVNRLVHLGLLLTQSLMGTVLPGPVASRLQADRDACVLADWVRAGLFRPSANTTHYEEQAARYVFMVRAREHWADKLRIVLFSTIKLPHPDAPEWIDLPPRLAFLHHVFRPIRLMGEYGAVAWRRYLR